MIALRSAQKPPSSGAIRSPNEAIQNCDQNTSKHWKGHVKARAFQITKSGWWLYTHPSEKYEFVNWDDEIPNISGKMPN